MWLRLPGMIWCTMSELNIKTVGGNGTFAEVVAQASPEIQALALAARALLAEVAPGITEVPWARQKIAGYGIGRAVINNE